MHLGMNTTSTQNVHNVLFLYTTSFFLYTTSFFLYTTSFSPTQRPIFAIGLPYTTSGRSRARSRRLSKIDQTLSIDATTWIDALPALQARERTVRIVATPTAPGHRTRDLQVSPFSRRARACMY